MKQLYKILASLMLVCLLSVSNQVEVFAGKPGTNSRSITSSNIEQTSATVTWLNGNGTGRLVVVYTGNVTEDDVDAIIADGTIYTGNSNFSTTGSSVLIDNTNGRAVAVYRNTGSTRTVNITGLSAGTEYNVKAYEYKNDGGIDPEYNENGGTRNPASFTTLGTPKPGKATDLLISEITDKDAEASWTAGSNATGYYLDLMNYTSQQMEYEGVDIGDVTNEFIEGLNASTNYGYRLQSYDDDGNTSDYTEFKTFTTLADVTAPKMTAVDYVSDNQFRIHFSEKVVFTNYLQEKFTISFTNKENVEVSENLHVISLEGPDYTSAICSTFTNLNTIKNGTDVTIYYENYVTTRVEDVAGNPMTSPSEILLTDWTVPQIAKIERVIPETAGVYTITGTTYGTSAETVYFRVTFDEFVKLTGSEHFALDFQDGGNLDVDSEGAITFVEMLDESTGELVGFASTYLVTVSTNPDNDCDGYSIYLTEGDEFDDNPIRDAYGNILTDKEVMEGGANEGFKVDRSPLSDLTNGPRYGSDEDFDENNPRFGASASSSKTGYVYNVSNLNGEEDNDLIYIKSFYDDSDCSIDGGKVELYYSVGSPENDEDYTLADNIYLTSENNPNWNQGYVTFEFDITSVINGAENEGENIIFKVVTTDIGENSTEKLVDFGTEEDYRDYLLYDVIAPNPNYDLIKDVDVENPISTIESNPSAFDGTNEIGAYNTMSPNDMNYNYINLDHNAVTTALGPLDPNDNTLLGGNIELKAKVIGDANWTNVDEFYDEYLSSNIDELFEQGTNNYSLDTKYMYVRFQNNGSTENFTGLLNAIGAEHGDEITFQVCVTDNAGNTTCYNTESSLELDLVRPNPADISIVGLAIGNTALDNSAEYSLLINNSHPTREYFNSAAQNDDKTLYFGYAINGGDYDQSLVGGKVYLEYRVSPYSPENVTGNLQDNWIKLAYTDGEMNDVLLDLNLAINTFELPANTNLYEELHTTAEINGDVYEFRLIPIDRAGNNTSEEDRMYALPSTYETIVLDNVMPKLVKAYSTDLNQFYFQEFAYCEGDMDDNDDRYFFNSNTGTVGGANDVIGAYFEFELDPTMNRPGNGASTRIQYFDGEGWSYLGSAGLYSSVNLGTMEDNFGEANYPQEDPTHFRVADWVNRQDVTNLWNNFAGDLDNEDDLRFEVVLNDVAGNTVTIYPTPTAEGDPFEESNAFIFRYDRTVPSVSVAFYNPTGCYNIGDNVQVDLTIGNNNANGNTNLTFVAESTMVNNVMLNTDCNIGQNYYDNCNANNLNGYAYGTTGNLSYTVGENDNSITDEVVVPFSVQVMDIAGNKSTVKTHITQATTAEQTPSIDTRLEKNNGITALKTYDINEDETRYLYGENEGEYLINQNTNYIKVEFEEEIPSHVSKIRIYYKIENNDDINYNYYPAEDNFYSGYLSIPSSEINDDDDEPFIIINISELETEYIDFASSTENQRLYFGVKFETATCEDDYNVNCDIESYESVQIDRVAPRIVRYEEVKDLVGGSSDFQDFLYDFEYNLATYNNEDDSDNDRDLEDNGDDYGYNVFTGPIVTKLQYNPVIDDNDIESLINNFNFIGSLGNNESNRGVEVLRTDFSKTNSYGIGYSILFSEPLYPTELNEMDLSQLYTKSNYIEDFIQVNDLVVVDNNNVNENATDASVNEFKFNHKYIQAPETWFADYDNNYSDEVQNVINNYFMLNIFVDGLVGNSNVDLSLDYTKLVDAAGNRLVDYNGEEFTENITMYDVNADIAYPLTIDNIAPVVSDFKVYTGVDLSDETNPIGEDLLSNTCFNLDTLNTFYVETIITEENELLFAQTIPGFDIVWDGENSYVEENTENAQFSFFDELDGMPYFIGMRNVTTGKLLGVIGTTINENNFIPGDEPNSYRLFVEFDIAEIKENSDNFNGIMMFDGADISEIDENISFTTAFSLDDFAEEIQNNIDNNSSESNTMIYYYALFSNLYKMDNASNSNFYSALTDENEYTIDNKAPVLDYLLANVYDNMDQALEINNCFTATGDGASTIVLSVSVNEKDGLYCGETDHFLTASNWNVTIGEDLLDPADYFVTDNINCVNCIPADNGIKTYYISIDLKNLTGDYTFDNEGTSGEYNYSLQVTDLVGNKGVSENPLYDDKGIVSNNPLYIDNTAPELSNVVGPEGCYTNGDNFTFKVQVQDLSVAEGACLSNYTTKSNWSVSLGTGISEVVFDGEDFSIENLGEGEFEFTVTIPESTYTANSEEVINVSFTDALGNTGGVTSNNDNRVKIVAETYEINLSSDDAVVCQDEETFVLEYTTNFTPTTSTVKVGETALTANEDYVLDAQNGTITINVDAVNDGDMITLTLGSDCDDVTSDALEVTVNPLPVTAGISYDSEDNPLCPNASVVFTATKHDNDENKDNYTYTWYYNTDSEASAEDNGWVLISANSNFTLSGNTLEVSGLTTDFKVKVTRTNEITGCVNATDDVSSFIDVKGDVEITGVTSDAPNGFPARGSSYTYTAAVTLGNGESVNDYNYIWEYSDSATSNVTYTRQTSGLTNTFTFASNAKPGKITVTAYSKACSTDVAEFESSFQDILVSNATRSVTFNSVTKTSMTVAWTKGTGDGKILIGNQSTLNVNSINKDYSTTPATFTDDLVTAMGSASANSSFTNGSNSFSTGILRSTGSGSLTYRFLMDDSDNTKDNQAISGLTSNTRYNFRVLDYVNYPSGAPRARLFSGNTNSNTRVTQAKEGDDNVGNTENTISLISPNPAKDNIAFTMNLVDTYPVTIELFSAEGRKVLVFKSNEIMNAGEHFINIPLGDLAAGYYSIVIGYGDEFILDSFIVMP